MLRKILDRIRSRARGATRRRSFRPEIPSGLEDRRVPAAVLPPGFTESVVTSGLTDPVALATTPDGRLLVAEGNGVVRVVANGQLLPQPAVTLPVDTQSVQGLMALTVDPNFTRNHYLYALEMVPSGVEQDQILLVRMTLNGNTVTPGTTRTLLAFPPITVIPGDALHVGAAMHFGVDQKLYMTVGDLDEGFLSQNLNNPYGKVLRVNSNGTIPRDDPYYRYTTGIDRSIWAVGLRNPYTFAVQPKTGLIYINNVGENTWESIDRGVRGANYGWPLYEGPATPPPFVAPVYAYAHALQPNPGEVAVSGGAFYDPAVATFPASYVGDYFFEDFGNGWIHTLNPTTGVEQTFASDLPAGMNDMAVGANGDLYFLNYFGGALYQIAYTG